MSNIFDKIFLKTLSSGLSLTAMKKKVLYVIGGILIVLTITNPGYSSLSAFLGEQEYSNINRKANYIVCSTYSVDFVTVDSKIQVNYFAILGKFYKVGN